MKYSKEDVLAYVTEEDVKFIRLAFVDYRGVQKNISIMPNELEDVLDHGFKIPSSSIYGFESFKTVTLIPDLDTIAPLPWRPSQGRVIRMFCDVLTCDPNVITPRMMLKKTIQETGLDDVSFFQHFEFYAFKLDEEGNNTYIAYDRGSFMDVSPLDKGEKVRRDICLNLSEMGIDTCGSYHSFGPGQNTICLVEASPMVAAENSITFGSVTRTLTSINGLEADFSANPIQNGQPSTQLIGIKCDGCNLDKYYSNLKEGFSSLRKYLVDENADFESIVEIDDSITIKGINYYTNFYLLYSDILTLLAR
ncbi:MAG: glutamine synthetase beta-grasp domain-containing protein [Bacilli bacterium]|nr:glutamine synthetase beta-grasp domain-containing protein [Bacilli bacterium]